MPQNHRLNRVALVGLILLSPFAFGRCRDDPQDVIGLAGSATQSIQANLATGLWSILGWFFDGQHPLIGAMILVIILALCLARFLGKGEHELTP